MKKALIAWALLIGGFPCVTVANPVPDTGQTKCYNDTGTEIIPCPFPGEDFYGQDAQYPCHPHSYTILPGGIMVQDNVTGLIWENKTDDSSVHDKDLTYFWDADVFINTLNAQYFGGYADCDCRQLKSYITLWTTA